MHAVVIRDTQLHWEERDDPVPGDTELLVAVRAAGLNGADMMQRQGLYPAPPGAPADIPGMELAGEVVAVGRQVTRFSPGDRVMALVGRRWPGHHGRGRGVPRPGRPRLARLARSRGVPRGLLHRLRRPVHPGRSAHGRAGAGLRRRRRGRHGRRPAGRRHRCLGGGDGARRQPSTRRSRALGAGVVVDPGEVAAHGPYDVVLELVGAASLPTVLPHLATGARVVVIGVGSGAKIELNLLQLMGHGRVSAAPPCVAGPGGRRRTSPPPWRPTCCRSSTRAGSGCRSAPPSRCAEADRGLRLLRGRREAGQDRPGVLSVPRRSGSPAG